MYELKISVVINTYNASAHLATVMDSLTKFDEIVVCDMHSSDNTIDIAKGYGCRIVYHEKMSFVEPARNFAIQAASHNWVFVVDADEIVPDGLRDYLYNYISEHPRCVGLHIPRCNYFMGRFMHAAYPDYILRFFDRRVTTWPEQIHLQPKIEGIVGFIPSKRKDLAFIHLQSQSVSDFFSKTNLYSSAEIEKRKKGFKTISFLYAPFVRFFKAYIIKGGFKDGVPGLIYATTSAIYKFMTLAKLYEAKQGENSATH